MYLKQYLKKALVILFLSSLVILIGLFSKQETPKVSKVEIEPIFDMKDIFEERNQHLNQQCQDLAERNQFPEMLFGLKERALAWCPVPKSGTSTWITYLMELSSKSKIEKQKLYEYYKPIGLDLALKITTQLTRKSWKYWVTSLELKHQKPVKFIVVRNPFDRLVSAFRDRIERVCPQEIWGNYHFHNKESVNKYRPAFLSKFGPDALSKAKNYGAIVPVSKTCVRKAEMPTFWEFAQWLINDWRNTYADLHIVPIVNWCAICSMDYDYIIKQENFDFESIEFLRQTDLLQYISNQSILESKHKIQINRPEDLTSRDITIKYMSVLSNEDILALYKAYELDFKLFDYSFTVGNLTVPLENK